MRNPINPKLLRADSKRWNNPGFASGKIYLAVLIGGGVIFRARRTFQRASEAKTYAERLLKVWLRVYPLFVKWSAEPQQTEPTP